MLPEKFDGVKCDLAEDSMHFGAEMHGRNNLENFGVEMHDPNESVSYVVKIEKVASLELWIVFVISLKAGIEGRCFAGGVVARSVSGGIWCPFARSGEIGIRRRDGSDQNCR